MNALARNQLAGTPAPCERSVLRKGGCWLEGDFRETGFASAARACGDSSWTGQLLPGEFRLGDPNACVAGGACSVCWCWAAWSSAVGLPRATLLPAGPGQHPFVPAWCWY